MSTPLDTAKFIWDIFKDGAKLDTADKQISVLPKGAEVADLSPWNGPVSYPEKYKELSFLFQSDLADLTLTPNWQHNGHYIANFNVTVDGTVEVLSSIDVRVTTFAGTLDDDGIVEMQYHLDVKFSNVTGGTKNTTFRAVARGDGGGRSLSLD